MFDLSESEGGSISTPAKRKRNLFLIGCTFRRESSGNISATSYTLSVKMNSDVLIPTMVPVKSSRILRS